MMRLVTPDPTITAVADDDLDATERAVFAPVEEWLAQQGFHPVGTAHYSPSFALPGAKRRAARYFLSDDRLITASLTLAAVREGGRGHAIQFRSQATNGTQRITLNRSGSGSLSWPPHLELEDGYLTGDAAQLARHRERLTDFAATPCNDFTQALQSGRDNDADILHFWQRQGWIRRHAQGYSFTITGAWRILNRVRNHQRQLRTTPSTPVIPNSAEAVVASEKAFLTQQLAIARGTSATTSRRRGALLFAGSLAVFLLAGRLNFGVTTLVALTAVLFLHELGHYFAMRWMGYRDPQIFFLPLLGAATTGHNDSAKPWQQLIVFLAGPVPGLLLGLLIVKVALFSHRPLLAFLPAEYLPPLTPLVTMLLIINYLNLLPFAPLDGGRVVELLYVARRPMWHFWFQVICAGAFALAWKLTNDPVLLFLTFIAAIGLPFNWQAARVSRELQAEFGRHPEEADAIDVIAHALSIPEHQKLPPARRVSLAQRLLPRLRTPPAGLGTVVTGTVLYVAFLMLPLLLLLPVISKAGHWHDVTDASPQVDPYRVEIRRLESALAQAQTGPARLHATLNLVETLQESDEEADMERSRQYAAQTYTTLTPALAETPEAADLSMLYANALTQDAPLAQKVLSESYDRLSSHHPDEFGRLARIDEQRERLLGDAGQANEHLELLADAYSLYTRAGDNLSRTTTGLELARLAFADGRREFTDLLLQDIDHLTSQPNALPLRLAFAEARAWQLVREQRAGEAVTLLNPLLPAFSGHLTSISLPRTAAWALAQNGRAPEGIALLQHTRDTLKASSTATFALGGGEAAMLMLDELLLQRLQGNPGNQERDALLAYVDANPVNRTMLVRQAEFDAGDSQWRAPMAKAELELLGQIGLREAACNADNRRTGASSAHASEGTAARVTVDAKRCPEPSSQRS